MFPRAGVKTLPGDAELDALIYEACWYYDKKINPPLPLESFLDIAPRSAASSPSIASASAGNGAIASSASAARWAIFQKCTWTNRLKSGCETNC
jgi:hypothetical protein